MIRDRLRAMGFGRDSIAPPLSLDPRRWLRWWAHSQTRIRVFKVSNWEGKRRLQPLGKPRSGPGEPGPFQYRYGAALRWDDSLFVLYRMHARPWSKKWIAAMGPLDDEIPDEALT